MGGTGMLQRTAPARSASGEAAIAVFGVVVSALTAALLLAGAALAPAMVRLEHFAADARTALLADRSPRPHRDIVVVSVDEDALARFAGHNYRSPTDRAVLARLVRVIDQASPRAIGIDFLFDRPTEPAKDDALALALRDTRSRVVLGAADERAGLTPTQRAWQAAFITKTGREAGHLSLTYDRDGIVRYVSRPARGGLYPASFAELLARDVPTPQEATLRPPVKPISADDYRNHRIAWLKVEGQPLESAFRAIPALALLNADASGNRAVLTALGALLRDRVVLIGGDFPDLDRHQTPLSAVGAPKLPGVQLHAHMVAQIIDRRAIMHAPPWAEPIAVFGLTLLGFFVGARWNVERFVYGIGVTMLVLVDAGVFLGFRTIMPFTLPLFGWLAGAWLGRNADLFLRRRRRSASA
jgi:adenylate cyclase